VWNVLCPFIEREVFLLLASEERFVHNDGYLSFASTLGFTVREVAKRG
jgi:hypothetical protein